MLTEWIDKFSGMLRKGNTDGSHRLDGGTSCYRPIRRRNDGEEEMARRKAAEYAAENPSVAYAHSGFTGMNAPMQDTGFATNTINGEYSGGNTGFYTGGTTCMTDGMSRGYTPMHQASDNISYMPGAFAPDAGNSYTHVEHIMAMTSLKSCYEAIECMKNGETLIVSLDAIANDGESTRCQDMLAGAAFTLGCGVRMLQGGRLVLIAPAGVKILPEQQRNTYRPEQNMPPRTPAAPIPTERPAFSGRRERRTSQNTAGWDPSRRDENRNFNPYTGNMPAAAGEYASFGGYGY